MKLQAVLRFERLLDVQSQAKALLEEEAGDIPAARRTFERASKANRRHTHVWQVGSRCPPPECTLATSAPWQRCARLLCHAAALGALLLTCGGHCYSKG